MRRRTAADGLSRGCVSGAMIAGVREMCDKGDETYDFDAVDGFDELGYVSPPHLTLTII
jgi:hypothetical protein